VTEYGVCNLLMSSTKVSPLLRAIAAVWILSGKDLVSSLWHYWEVVKPLKMVPVGDLPWASVPEGDIETLTPSLCCLSIPSAKWFHLLLVPAMIW
jgi:hypothetical protein